MTSQIHTAALLQQIKNQIELKRAAGLYPPGLEQELEREFDEIMASTNRRYFASEDLLAQLNNLEDAFGRLSGQISARSRIPLATFVHRVLGKITKRQVLGLTAQIRDVESLVIIVLKMLGEFAKGQEEADRRTVLALSQHVLDRVSVIDHLAIISSELETRVRELESRIGK